MRLGTMASTVRLLSTLALKGALRSLAENYQAASGTRIEADYAPTLALLDRLRTGEAADVLILTKESLAELAAAGSVVSESCVDRPLLCRCCGEGRRRSS